MLVNLQQTSITYQVMGLFRLFKLLVALIIFNLCCDCKETEVLHFREEINKEESADSFKDSGESFHTNLDGKSTANCGYLSGCNRYKATIYNLISTSRSSGSVKTVTLDPKRTFFNNETTELNQTFKVNKAVTETAALELSHAFRLVDSIEFEDSVLTIFQDSKSTALKKLKAGLSTAFQIESTSKQSSRYGVAAKKLYKFARTVTVSYCEEYEITSVLEMAENTKTTYQATLKINGEDSSGRKLSEKEVQDGLDVAQSGFTFLKGDPDENEFTAIATTDVNLIETYVDNNITVGNGIPIPECLAAFTVYTAKVFSLAKASSNEGSKRDMAITYKSTFINNARDQEYHNASFGYLPTSDYAEFQFSKGLGSMSSINFESGVIAAMIHSLPSPFRTKATGKLINALPTAFLSGSKLHLVEDKTDHDAQTTAPVPSCIRDERWFAAKMVENIETNYDILVKITAYLKCVGKIFSADEIRKNLKSEKGLTFLSNADPFTAVAQTTAKLVESYVESVIIKNNSTKIRLC